MKLDEHTARVLDLPIVLEQIARHASFSLGRELVLSLSPASDAEDAKNRLRLTSEARLALSQGLELSLGGVHDVRPFLRRAVSGSLLDPQELLDIRDTLSAAARIKKALGGEGRTTGRLSGLASIAAQLDPLQDLVAEIEAKIGEDGQVLDGASPALARLRRSIREAHQAIMERLQAIVSSPKYQGTLQDRIVTQRDGRYVVLVKAEAKSQLPGLLHDQSASGATLYVEPLEVVELTNRWRALQRQGEREVARILGGLTKAVARFAGAIEQNVWILGELDSIMAMARYADETDAAEPLIVDPCQDVPIELRRARHPLIPRDQVVPIDVWLKGFRILVITGPNTGGKTVVLKTVGLMAAMAMCGLHIPAQSGSAVPAVDAIYADIGDEQGIVQNLSTFSSHVQNIARILKSSTERSLVLLDEIGAGTDPEEGSALGRALLAYLLRRGALVLATSHHSDVKAFAYRTEGVENASVEFDEDTLAPTYRLRIGVPGSSHAIAVARRLGLPEEVVRQAEAFVSPDRAYFEGLVRDLQKEMVRLEEARGRLEAEERHVRTAREELEAKIRQVDAEREQVRKQALEAVAAEVEVLKERLRQLLKAAEAREASSQWYRRALRQADSLVREAAAGPEGASAGTSRAAPLKPGQRVWLDELRSEGELEKLSDGRALVRVGNLLVSVAASSVKPAGKEGETGPVGRKVSLPSPPPLQLKVVGMRTAEAEAEVERYLNRAALAGLQEVRIIHGVGTGALRNFLRSTLRNHPLVASLRPAGPEEGGDGVTIVRLNAV